MTKTVRSDFADPVSTAPLGEPSQDPRPQAQEPIDAATAEREANSVVMGGGMAAGAAAGAAIGTAVAGPVGVLVGGTVGAILGALGGYAAVDAADPEHTYWKENYSQQPGVVRDYSYEEDYAPAYRLGYQGRARYAGQTWEQAEPTLARDWQEIKDKSRLSWEQAKAATHAAWSRSA